VLFRLDFGRDSLPGARDDGLPATGQNCDNCPVNVERTKQGHNQLLKELNEERLAALRRISGVLEALIEQLQGQCDRIATLDGADRERELEAYRETRAQALKYRWYLDVQREAIGLRPNRIVDEFYAIPTLDEVGKRSPVLGPQSSVQDRRP